MNMKIHQWFFATVCAFALSGAAHAALYDSGLTTVGSQIPDGNLNPLQNTLHISSFGSGDTVVADSVRVTVNISGGYNGDLYGYLVSSSGGFAVLLNRVGVTHDNPLGANDFGNNGSGFNVTFVASPTGIPDIHTFDPGRNNAVVNTSVGVDGRNINPQTGAFATTPNRTALLSSFNGLTANGDWTLAIADVLSGDIATLDSWRLEFTATPEPVHLALGIFGALFGVVQAGRYLRRKRA
jgi:subtilisin-like proprotein convertase family protein